MTGHPSTPDVVAHQVGQLVDVVERLRADLADMREEQAAREARDVERERHRAERDTTRERHDTERYKALDARIDALDVRLKPVENTHVASGWLRTGLTASGGAIVVGAIWALVHLLGSVH